MYRTRVIRSLHSAPSSLPAAPGTHITLTPTPGSQLWGSTYYRLQFLVDIQSQNQNRNSPKVRNPEIHTVWILGHQNQLFYSAHPFPQTHVMVMCITTSGRPPAVPYVGAVCCSLCFPGMFLCSWIFPNRPSVYRLWPQTEENSVMTVVNLKLPIFS